MARERFDVLVVGAGPAGSIAATVLARGGAKVALLDKAQFPRDKACGDLIGPRGVQLLADLGIDVPTAARVDDMVVVGPTGRRVRLPCYQGDSYPGYALAVPRACFDALCYQTAVDAGATPVVGRAADPLLASDGSLEGFCLSTGGRVLTDAVIGADGATSRVAEVAGLVDPALVLWGFALRAYVDDAVSRPHIVLWEQESWRAFPGYGWLFPGVGGRANLGLGIGVLADRGAATRAVRTYDAFATDLRRLGVLAAPGRPSARLGGWLKMGMVGTTPARGRVLLAGDAAGLVNPLQGEGISQAMGSGRAAASALLAGVGGAAGRYQDWLTATYAPYQSITAPVHRALVARPAATAVAGRLLTSGAVGPTLAGGWSIFWNDLLDGAPSGSPRRVAAVATVAGRTAAAAAGRAATVRRRRLNR